MLPLIIHEFSIKGHPEERHETTGNPLNVYPGIHAYTAVFPKVVPSGVWTNPFWRDGVGPQSSNQ